MTKIDFYLASTSPRRKQLLEQLGFAFACLAPNVPEEINEGETPIMYAERLARDKAFAGWHSPQRKEHVPVLGSDTIVVYQDHVLEKPKNKEDGVRMLQLLSGNTHDVLTAVAVVQDEKLVVTRAASRVAFRDITLAEAEWYWSTQEPVDKAGGYAIQGKGAIFVKHIEGSCSGVIGLPLFETVEVLGMFGVKVL